MGNGVAGIGDLKGKQRRFARRADISLVDIDVETRPLGDKRGHGVGGHRLDLADTCVDITHLAGIIDRGAGQRHVGARGRAGNRRNQHQALHAPDRRQGPGHTETPSARWG